MPQRNKDLRKKKKERIQQLMKTVSIYRLSPKPKSKLNNCNKCLMLALQPSKKNSKEKLKN